MRRVLAHELVHVTFLIKRGALNVANNLNGVVEARLGMLAHRLNGVDAEWLTPEQVKEFCPILNTSPNVRYAIMGATLQRRGGIARDDAVAWGFARGADRLGVDLVQNCQVIDIDVQRGPVVGVQTTNGPIGAQKILLCGAGHTSGLASRV